MARNLNGAPITAREADAIEAALIAAPGDLSTIAARFNRSVKTIRRVGYARGCSTSTSTSATMGRSSIPVSLTGKSQFSTGFAEPDLASGHCGAHQCGGIG